MIATQKESSLLMRPVDVQIMYHWECQVCKNGNTEDVMPIQKGVLCCETCDEMFSVGEVYENA